MYKILKREEIIPNIHLMTVATADICRNAQAGEFVVVRSDERGERIPLNLVDWDPRSATVVFMAVGTSTRKLAAMKPGEELATLSGPLGRPTGMVKDKTVLAIGGCYGIAALYPVIRSFKENNNRVVTAIEGRSSFLLYWQDNLGRYSDELHEITRDGTRGFKGHISDFLADYLSRNKVDIVYCQGCTYLNYLVSESTRPSGTKTIVGLNPIMIDATGMCGVCRVIINGETKFACVDGPEFDGHTVDWNNLLTRRHMYLDDERRSLSFYECEING